MLCPSSAMIQLKFEYHKYISVTSKNRPNVCCHDSLLFDGAVIFYGQYHRIPTQVQANAWLKIQLK